MNENIRNIEDTSLPEGLKRFCKNVPCASQHNLYLLQTRDMDGNITGEAYGMNLMTDAGMNKVWCTTKVGNGRANIKVGSGDTDPTLTDTTLSAPLFSGLAATKINSNIGIYPMKYDPTSGIITSMNEVMSCYYDYNISNVTTDTEIRELGIFGDSNSDYIMITHALVYDSEGNKSSITKKINEKLIINVFVSASINKTVIQNAYDNGLYFFVDPWLYSVISSQTYATSSFNVASFTRSGSVNNSNGYDYWFYNSSITDHSLTGSIICPTYLVEDTHSHIAGFCNRYQGTYNFSPPESQYSFAISYDELDTPEELESIYAYTDGINDNELASIMGAEYSDGYINSMLPVTNFNIQSLNMYNHITHKWDIAETYANDENTDYNTILTKILGQLWITINGKSQTVYVYINDHTELPITKFSNTGIIYASDEYWDASTYVRIDDPNNVPEASQTKRYYMFSVKQIIYPKRPPKVIHKINTAKTSYNIVPDKTTITAPSITFASISNSSNYKGFKALSSDQYNWIMTNSDLLYILDDGETVKKYTLTGPSNTEPHGQNRWATETGDKLVIMGGNSYNYSSIDHSVYKSKVRIYTVIDADSAPTYVDVTLPFSTTPTSSYDSGYSMFTWCDNGFLVATVNNIDTVVLDIYGDDGNTPKATLINNAKWGFALNRSNYCVYQKTDVTDSLTFDIYDMKNNVVVKTFSISTSATNYTFTGIAGWKNWVYVQVNANSTYSTYLYDIEQESLTFLENMNISCMRDITTSRYGTDRIDLSVDECYICARSGVNGKGNSTDNIQLFNANDPTNPVVFGPDDTRYATMYRTLRQMCATGQLKYVNDGKQLLLVKQSYGAAVIVVDIGYILDNGPYKYYPSYHFYRTIAPSINSEYYDAITGSCGLFKNGVYVIDNHSSQSTMNWYPLEAFIHHKITGTTRTISAYNNPFQISNKQFTMSITNDMSRLT